MMAGTLRAADPWLDLITVKIVKAQKEMQAAMQNVNQKQDALTGLMGQAQAECSRRVTGGQIGLDPTYLGKLRCVAPPPQQAQAPHQPPKMPPVVEMPKEK